jgi:hypothetical protein
MKESDVRKVGEERERPLSGATPEPGQDRIESIPEPVKREAEDEWLAFAAEDPAFFIKPSDTA